MKKLTSLVLSSMLLFNSCASITSNISNFVNSNLNKLKAKQEAQQQINDRNSQIQNAKVVLGIDEDSMEFLPEDYICAPGTLTQLRALAGVYTGKGKIIKLAPGDYLIKSKYSEYLNPETMKKMRKYADRNSDKIITFDEYTELTENMYEVFK